MVVVSTSTGWPTAIHNGCFDLLGWVGVRRWDWAGKRQISGDCTLKVLNRDAHGKISDVDVAAAVTT